jgi:hypothetical protein
MWEPRRLTILWAFTACYRDSFTFYHLMIHTKLCTYVHTNKRVFFTKAHLLRFQHCSQENFQNWSKNGDIHYRIMKTLSSSSQIKMVAIWVTTPYSIIVFARFQMDLLPPSSVKFWMWRQHFTATHLHFNYLWKYTVSLPTRFKISTLTAVKTTSLIIFTDLSKI